MEIAIGAAIEAAKGAAKEVAKEVAKNEIPKPIEEKTDISDIKIPDIGKGNEPRIVKASEIFDKFIGLDTESIETDFDNLKEKTFDVDAADSVFDKFIDADVEELADDGEDSEDEILDTKGGSYRDVKKGTDGETHEVHHMPADSAYDLLDRNDGPAIKMEKEDHRETASCGNSKEAREYRAKQAELIEQGKFMEALKMDIEDILEKFGDKYNDAIKEMLDYVKELVDKGVIQDPGGILEELYEMIGYGGQSDE